MVKEMYASLFPDRGWDSGSIRHPFRKTLKTCRKLAGMGAEYRRNHLPDNFRNQCRIKPDYACGKRRSFVTPLQGLNYSNVLFQGCYPWLLNCAPLGLFKIAGKIRKVCANEGPMGKVLIKISGRAKGILE